VCAPGCRKRHHGRRQEADRGHRFPGDRAEQAGEQLGHRNLGAAEQHAVRVDVPFRVGLETGRLGVTETQRVPAHVDPPGRVEMDRGRQQRLAVEEQRPGPPVRPAQHRHRVRGAQVDAEREAVARTPVWTGHRSCLPPPYTRPVMLRPSYR
jgi:hypothetical protein